MKWQIIFNFFFLLSLSLLQFLTILPFLNLLKKFTKYCSVASTNWLQKNIIFHILKHGRNLPLPKIESLKVSITQQMSLATYTSCVGRVFHTFMLNNLSFVQLQTLFYTLCRYFLNLFRAIVLIKTSIHQHFSRFKNIQVHNIISMI